MFLSFFFHCCVEQPPAVLGVFVLAVSVGVMSSPIKFTQIARVRDGLILAASFEETPEAQALRPFQEEAKTLFRAHIKQAPPRESLQTGSYVFHLVIETPPLPRDDKRGSGAGDDHDRFAAEDNRVCLLTLCDRSYPDALAFDYLKDLSGEFFSLYKARDIASADRPYCFVKFDTFIRKTMKVFMQSSINAQLHDVQQVMRKNIADVLTRGEKMETIAHLSSQLSSSSRSYLQNAQELNRQALLKKYGPVVVGVVIFLLLVFILLF